MIMASHAIASRLVIDIAVIVALSWWLTKPYYPCERFAGTVYNVRFDVASTKKVKIKVLSVALGLQSLPLAALKPMLHLCCR
jgi:hypothetical protein